MPSPDPQTSARGRALSTVTGILAGVLGALALLGWTTGHVVLASLGQGYVPMAPSTALLFLLFGVLALWRPGPEPGTSTSRLGLSLSALGGVAALTLLVLSSLGVRSEVEHLGMPIDGAISGTPVGHMSPLTALGFVLTAGVLVPLFAWGARGSTLGRLSLFPAWAVLILGAGLTIAYALGGPVLYGSGVIPPALTTSLAFLALGTTLVARTAQSTRAYEESSKGPSPRVAGLLILAVILGAGGTLTAAILYFKNYEDHFRAQVEEQLVAVADLKVGEILQWREERFGDARVYTQNPGFRDLVAGFLANPEDPAIRGRLRTWLERIQGAYDYDQVAFIDARGFVRLAVPELAGPDSVAPRREVLDPLASGEVDLLDFHRHGADEPVYLAVLAPISDLGVLRFRVDPTLFLYPLLRRWPGESRTAETLLVRREGDQVLFLNDLRFREGSALRLRRPVADTALPAAKAVRGHEGLTAGRDYRGVPVAAAVRAVPGSPWYLVARMDEEEIYAPLRERLWWTVALTGALLAAMGLAVALAWRHRARLHSRRLRETETSRRRTEERYRSLFESIRDAILVADTERRITDCNPAFTELFGYERDEIVGQETAVIYETEKEFREMGSELRDASERWKLARTLSFETRDGRVFPGEATAFPLTDAEGEVTGFVALIRDVTARKAAEDALRKSEERYRTLVEDAPVGIFTTTSDGRPVAVNTALARMLGFEGPEGALAHYRDLKNDLYVSPERRDEFLRELRAKGRVDHFEYEAWTGDGDRVWLEMSARVVEPEPDGSFIIEGFVTDITDRKRAEEALRRSQALLEGSQALAKVGGWEYDVSDERLYWTREVFRIHDLDPDDFEPGSPALLDASLACYPGQARERVLHAFEQCLQKAVPYDLELPFVTAEGREIWIRTAGQPVLEDGEVVKVVGNIMDITEQKRAWEEQEMLQEQLVQAQKMESVGKLAGGVAHDFNNMLSVILGNVEMALAEVEDSSPLHRDLLEIRKAARRSADLTRQLLGFARRQTIAPRVLDLNETIESMLKMLRRLIGEDVKLSWEPGTGLWPVKMDPTQIDQILANLVINARDALDGGGKVTIETANVELDAAYSEVHPGASPGPHVVLTVSDEGHGMTQEVQSQVFEPFFTTKSAGEGTGLGLATVYGIVKQNRGSINVYSEPGEGTSFKIYLPRAEPAPSREDEELETEELRGGDETILIVEDEPAVLKLSRRLLDELGYTTLVARAPAEALALVGEGEIEVDLLLTDVVMPGMNGQELADEMERLHPGLAVVFMSGYPARAMGEKGVLEPDVEFLQKPFSAMSLAMKVRDVLDRRQSS